MAGRMSNKDRIARLAAEKDAERKEKAKKKAASKKKKATSKRKTTKRSSRSSTKSAGRLKAVWVVCDQSGTPVKTFAYGEKAQAEKEAKKLTDDKNKLHFVKMDKVPME
jgi:hypothetical protein